MSTILVFAEHDNGKVKKGALELLTAAKTSGKSIISLALGSGAKNAANELAHYGAQKVMCNEDANFDKYNPELFTNILETAVKESGADTLLASSSMLGRDLFPRLAARLETGVVSDCVDLSFDGDSIGVKRPLYAGKCSANVEFKNSPVKIVLMRANQLPVDDADTGKTAEVIDLANDPKDLRTLIKDIVKGASEKLDLTEANIIVSGGRGMKDANGFKVLDELADVLGATVGASRAVVDAGWVPHSMQVGQTGKTVAPTLYIACGISGAIQHLAGMNGSKVIVAINKDPEAPIFQKSTYGIVGDVFEVVPQLKEEFKQLLS